MLATTYTPNCQFGQMPTMTLVAKDGKLIMLDWFDKKTNVLMTKISQSNKTGCLPFVACDKIGLSDPNSVVLARTVRELTDYFTGSLTKFSIPVDLSFGTAFEQKVWQALIDIDYGTTISYKTLAKNIGKPTAYRAVANANGRNLISLIVPCHRVIASNGGLGGYTGGTWIKQTLLNVEKFGATKLSRL